MTRLQRMLSAALLLLGFALMAWMMLSRALLDPAPFPLQYADEQGHYAYTQHLIENDQWWPDLNSMRMEYVRGGVTYTEPNYINHPPTFYWLMKLVQQTFPTDKPVQYRAVSLIFYITALALYALIGWRMAWPPIVTAFYAVVPFLFRLELQGGLYGNDAAAMLGGTLAVFAAQTWWQRSASRGALLMAAALAFASVKLNALLLVGLFCAFVLLQAYRTNLRISRTAFGALVAWGALLLVPFLLLTLQYGSPAPNSIGQYYMLTHGHPSLCVAQLPMEGFFTFAGKAIGWLTDQTPGFELTRIGSIALLLCWLGAALLPSGAGRAIALASAAAVALTLLVHFVFSYQRYTTYGWAIDMMARYYFPLMAAYGITITAAIASLLQQKDLDHD